MKASSDESLRQAVPPKSERRRKREVDVRAVSQEALLKVLEPLAGFAFDAGLSIQDVCALFRIAAVQSVAAQQLEATKRINISGIAASTGIPRAEVSRILKGSKATDSKPRVQSTHRILAAWREDPRFTTPNGQPANLKIYGKGATFETLVKEFGRGLPTRAVLDELSRAQVVDMCIGQTVRLKISTLVGSDSAIPPLTSFGDRLSELAETLLRNLRIPENSYYVTHMSEPKIDISNLPLIRKQLAAMSLDMMSGFQDVVTPRKNHAQRSNSNEAVKLALTIFCHESPSISVPRSEMKLNRANLRRSSGGRDRI